MHGVDRVGNWGVYLVGGDHGVVPRVCREETESARRERYGEEKREGGATGFEEGRCGNVVDRGE